MEPTIYKPSIYKGAGIYKIGNGGGGGFNGIFELDIAALDLTKNRDVQNSTIIDLTNKENIEKIGNKLILKNAFLEVDLLQHVKDNTTKIKVEIKCNILNLADYGYIGSKFLTTFGSNYVFQKLTGVLMLFHPGKGLFQLFRKIRLICGIERVKILLVDHDIQMLSFRQYFKFLQNFIRFKQV